MVILGVMLAVLSGAGCEKDTDCKGDRVCDNGKCVSPQVNLATPVAPPVETQSQRVPLGSSPAPSTEPRTRRVPLGSGTAPVSEPDGLPPPPPPPPQEERRVPLGNGAPVRAAPAFDACEDPLDADGRLKAECRVAPGPVSSKARRNRRASAEVEENEEPPARAVGMLGVMYGALIGGGAALPAFGFTAAAGVRFRSGVGFVGVVHGRIYAGSAGSMQLYGLGPGVRFGNRSQLTLALTGTFTVINVGTIRASGGLFSVLAQIAICLGDYFTLLIQPTIDFDGSGVIGSITGGIGVTF